MAKLLQYWKGLPKPAFSENVQKEDQEKFFKNRPKSKPRLKSPKALCRKWHYPAIIMHVKWKDWRSYGNFCKVTLNPHFLKKCKGGDQDKFFKNRLTSSPRLKGPTALWRKLHHTLIKMQLKWKNWRRFWRKRRIQNCPNGQVMEILARSPKTFIF